MLFNLRLPGPFARVPIAWVVAVILFILAWVSEQNKAKSGNVQALIFVVAGVLLVVRGAMVFNQRRPDAATKATVPGGAIPQATAAFGPAFATAAPGSPATASIALTYLKPSSRPGNSPSDTTSCWLSTP